MNRRKIALVDVDQVLADTWTLLTEKCAPSLRGVHLTSWGLLEAMQPDEQVVARNLMKKDLFWSNLPVIAGAKEGLQLLRNDGFQVVALTSPWIACRRWEYARRKWLAQSEIRIKPHNLIVGAKKWLVHGDLFIDDKVENVQPWSEHNTNGAAVIYDYSYNASLENPKILRMFGWQDLDRILRLYNESKFDTQTSY